MMAALLDLDRSLWWTVDGLVGADWCRTWIERIEAAPREIATINTAAGHVLNTNIRNNTRVIVDDFDTAGALWSRMKPHVPTHLNGWDAVGLNERFRCYRYEPGQRFGPHYDGAFVRSDDERSMLTVLVYLNGGFDGGETNLLELGETIVPDTGRTLFFQHPILHEGADLVTGIKYRAAHGRDVPQTLRVKFVQRLRVVTTFMWKQYSSQPPSSPRF